MKKLILIFSFIFALQTAFGQVLLTEGFQNYQGIGDVPTNGWSTSGNFGFKVYLRALSADSNVKICEINLNNNKKGDSLITPFFGPLNANATLTFKSRLVDSYTGIFATFKHIVAAGDKVSAYVSSDGTNYTFLQDLLPGYTASGTGFSTFNLPVNGYEGSSVKVKFVCSRTAGEWYPGFDDFVATNVTSNSKALHSNTEVSLFPNPSTGSVLVTAPGFSSKATVEVFNILGNKITSAVLVNGKVQLDLSELKSGIYLIRVSEGKQVSVSRLILK